VATLLAEPNLKGAMIVRVTPRYAELVDHDQLAHDRRLRGDCQFGQRGQGTTLIEAVARTTGSCTALAVTVVEPPPRATSVAVESVEDAIAATAESVTCH
jgi:hypothetical protein